MLYIMKEQGTFFHKVGFSDDPTSRLKILQTGNPRPLELVYVKQFPKRHIRRVEATIQSRLKAVWRSGEWFEADTASLLNLIGELYGHNDAMAHCH